LHATIPVKFSEVFRSVLVFAFAARTIMPDDHPNNDTLFVRLGDYFQAGANGRFAICALVVIALTVIASRFF
jgi:hypothetical protein